MFCFDRCNSIVRSTSVNRHLVRHTLVSYIKICDHILCLNANLPFNWFLCADVDEHLVTRASNIGINSFVMNIVHYVFGHIYVAFALTKLMTGTPCKRVSVDHNHENTKRQLLKNINKEQV